jgi:hypothetical protein
MTLTLPLPVYETVPLGEMTGKTGEAFRIVAGLSAIAAFAACPTRSKFHAIRRGSHVALNENEATGQARGRPW